MKGQVEVVKEGLEARFSWKPDESGEEWSVESLRSLLSAADIRVDVDDTDLEKALDFFDTTPEGGVSDAVAKGAPAVDPKPLNVKITASDLPAEMAAGTEVILKETPPEDGLDGEDTAWADEGEVVGTVHPAVAARPGIALNRNPLPPAETAGEDFIIGSNLRIRGTDLVAEASGILRYGENGAELIPCSRHQWSVEGSLEEGGCFLSFHPGHEALPLPAVTDIFTAAGKAGFLADKLCSEDKIRSWMAAAVSENSGFTGKPLSRDTDGRISLFIDPQQVLAELRIVRETGNGVPLKLPSIAAAVRNSGLRGVDGDRVKKEIMEFWKGDSDSAVIVLKQGQEPERGPDRELENQVPFLEEQDAASIRDRMQFEPERVRGLSSLSVFPPTAVSKMAVVEKGDQVARLGSAKEGKPGKDIYGSVIPGFPGNDPIIQVHEGLDWEGDNLVARTAGVMDLGVGSDDITHVRIRPHRDAEIRVEVSPDRIKAFVSTRLPVGTGAPVDADRITDAAEKAGVQKGLLHEAIEEVVELSRSGEIVTGFLIAEGRLPMEGNTRLSLAVSGDPAKAPIPVKAGDLIGTIESGEESGWDVFGEPLLNEGASLQVGDCIIREEDDGVVTLKAERGGHLQMNDDQIYVRDLLDYVGDVSLASGNIRFPGRIKIEGSILSRVIVDAGEGVDVSQVVQAALVNSGGDIKIGKGIKGEGRAVIRSQGSIHLGYAEEANLLATGDVIVSKALMNCRVKCNGRLEFSGGDSRLIGGVMKLKDGLICNDVGNERGAETIVSFGQDYLVENQIDQVQKELQKIQDFLDKTDAMMDDLEQKPGSGRKLIMIRQKKVDALKMQEKKNMRLFLLREKFERHFESEVRITGTVWPGTTFESHGRLIKISDPIRGIRIFFDREKGLLVKKPI